MIRCLTLALVLFASGCQQSPPAAAPATPSQPGTVVSQVYPSASELPENLLKFYIHFSAPMSRGEAYERIHLLDAAGKEIDGPFLELGEELWDPKQTRFTLFFDPGRIKRGLKPREEIGPALEEGKSYTLVIDKAWLDAQGNPLKEPYRKTFKVGPPKDTPPNPKEWTLTPGKAETCEPLTVRFPDPMDHAMLVRVLRVTDAAGQDVAGELVISQQETSWRFSPRQPWKPGKYKLVFPADLEDLAGNSIDRPFEVDVFRPVQRRVDQGRFTLPFELK